MKPICVPCQRFLQPKQNGICFVEQMPRSGARPGRSEPEKWKPYKLWTGDLWQCPECYATIIVGVPEQALAEHFQSEFEALRTRHVATLTINDC